MEYGCGDLSNQVWFADGSSVMINLKNDKLECNKPQRDVIFQRAWWFTCYYCSIVKSIWCNRNTRLTSSWPWKPSNGELILISGIDLVYQHVDFGGEWGTRRPRLKRCQMQWVVEVKIRRCLIWKHMQVNLASVDNVVRFKFSTASFQNRSIIICELDAWYCNFVTRMNVSFALIWIGNCWYFSIWMTTNTDQQTVWDYPLQSRKFLEKTFKSVQQEPIWTFFHEFSSNPSR